MECFLSLENETKKTEMKKLLYLLLLAFFFSVKGLAQPLDNRYDGYLEFKVYKDGKQVDLSAKNWKVIPNNGLFKEPTDSYKFPNFYRISAGGFIRDDFYLDIVFKKDTMRIYTPSFIFYRFTIDNIPFKKGVYKIPQYVFDLKHTKMLENKNYTPNVNDNWDLFKKETYRCYPENVKFLDTIIEKDPRKFDWEYITTPTKQTYFFHSNLIIKTNDRKNYKGYEVNNITDILFWDTRPNPQPIESYVKSLFYENDTLFAIIERYYPGFRTAGRVFGLYKLHFVEEGISEELEKYLKEKQIEEDYKVAIWLTEKEIKPLNIRLEEIKSEYNKIIKE